MQIGRYKNRTLEDAKCYLESVFGIKIDNINKHPEVRKQIEENAKDGYILDCLLVRAFI